MFHNSFTTAFDGRTLDLNKLDEVLRQLVERLQKVERLQVAAPLQLVGTPGGKQISLDTRQVQDMADQVNTLDVDLNLLEADVAVLTADVAVLTADVAVLTADVAALTAIVETITPIDIGGLDIITESWQSVPLSYPYDMLAFSDPLRVGTGFSTPTGIAISVFILSADRTQSGIVSTTNQDFEGTKYLWTAEGLTAGNYAAAVICSDVSAEATLGFYHTNEGDLPASSYAFRISWNPDYFGARILSPRSHIYMPTASGSFEVGLGNSAIGNEYAFLRMNQDYTARLFAHVIVDVEIGIGKISAYGTGSPFPTTGFVCDLIRTSGSEDEFCRYACQGYLGIWGTLGIGATVKGGIVTGAGTTTAGGALTGTYPDPALSRVTRMQLNRRTIYN